MKSRKLLLPALLAVMSFAPANAQEFGTIPDQSIRVVSFEELKYPTIAHTSHTSGVVVVRVTLDGTGKVINAVALSGSSLFIRDSLANIRKWQFQPNAEKAAVIVYNFTLPGGFCKTPDSLFMLRGNLATIIGCDVPVETSQSGK